MKKNITVEKLFFVLALSLSIVFDSCISDGNENSGQPHPEIGALRWLPNQSGFIIMADKSDVGWRGDLSPVPIRYSFYKIDTSGKILETLFEPEYYEDYDVQHFYMNQNGRTFVSAGYRHLLNYSLQSKSHFFIDSISYYDSPNALAVSPDTRLILIGVTSSTADTATYTIKDISDSSVKSVSSITTTSNIMTAQWLSENRIAFVQRNNYSDTLTIIDSLWKIIFSVPVTLGNHSHYILQYASKSDELFYSDAKNIKRISLSTQAITSFPQMSDSVVNFQVASDGSFALYNHYLDWKTNSPIKIVNLTTGASKNLIDQGTLIYEISPDNKKLAWTTFPIMSIANPFHIANIDVP